MIKVISQVWFCSNCRKLLVLSITPYFLNKLKWLGADDLTVQWFRSYLTGRTQVTDIGGTMSDQKCVTCGVPQGSIIGPLLFLF